MRKMKVTIGRDGKTRIEVLDAVGTDCREFSGRLEERLGVAGERVLKPEYYESVEETETVRQEETA